MTRLSLADEEIYAHASIRLSVPGIVIFVTSILLTALALSNVRKEIEPWEGNNDTMTRYLIENVENREQIPDNEWMPSLFRSTQLFIIVQVPIRIALLLAISHRLFLVRVALRYKNVMDSPTFTNVATPLLLSIEFLHVLTTFLFYTLHIWQDFKYNFFIRISVMIALMSFASKMVLSNLLKTSTTFAMIRGIFGVTTILIVSDILNNVTSFTYAMNCDQMVAPYDAMCEYIFLVMMFASYAMDILEMPSIQLCVTCSEEDAMDYNRLKMERKAAQLKKHNL
ncbi:hypothetical protein RB195_003300 [Necator americanus]|uniref:Serpentine receptor class gamma n=1 Tax=Necator americanus TaxID=51031 RepID=A0ABR1DMX2_NECAM